MAEAALVIKVGAVTGGALGALSSVDGTLKKIGETTDKLKEKQKQLGSDIKKYMGTLAPASLKSLNHEYEQLGKTIDKLKAKEAALYQNRQISQTLRDKRQAMRADLVDTVAIGATIAVPFKIAADFEDKVKDIAITGSLNRAEEIKLGKEIRHLALQYNQSQSEVAEMTKALVATGMDFEKARQLTPLITKTATATRTTGGDAAIMARSFELLNVKDINLAFNQAAKAGKLGSFELANMSRWFPQLGGYMKALNIQGNEAVVSMASRFQIATRTAGSNDEAANNFKNYLAKITSSDTIKDFAKLKIDLVGSLKESAAQGTDPIAASVGIVIAQLKNSAPEATTTLKKMAQEIANIKDPAERAAEMERRRGMIEAIGERAGLGTMFQDLQAVQYLLAELQNQSDLKQMMQEVKSGKDKRTGNAQIDEDFNRRMQGAGEQFKQLKTHLMDVGISLGSAILPAFNSLLKSVLPMVNRFAAWADKNQDLVASGIKVLAFLAAVKLGSFAARYSMNLMASGANTLATGFNLITSRYTMLTALMQGRVGGLQTVARMLGFSSSGAIRLASNLGKLGTVIRAVGIAFMTTPVGWIAAALGVAGFLIWKYWQPISGFFKGFWLGLKMGLAPIGAAFSAAFAPIKPILMPVVNLLKAVFNWIGELFTPFQSSGTAAQNWGVKVGLGVAQVIGWLARIIKFMVLLPIRFVQFGVQMGEGLINGISSMVSKIGNAISNIAESVKTKFKSILGIASPSRVFMGFGHNIGDGASIGIQQRVDHVKAAAKKLAGVALAGGMAVTGAAHANSTAAVTIHFSPTIHINGGADAQRTANLTVTELEKMLKKVLAEQQRRKF